MYLIIQLLNILLYNYQYTLIVHIYREKYFIIFYLHVINHTFLSLFRNTIVRY